MWHRIHRRSRGFEALQGPRSSAPRLASRGFGHPPLRHPHRPGEAWKAWRGKVCPPKKVGMSEALKTALLPSGPLREFEPSGSHRLAIFATAWYYLKHSSESLFQEFLPLYSYLLIFLSSLSLFSVSCHARKFWHLRPQDRRLSGQNPALAHPNR